MSSRRQDDSTNLPPMSDECIEPSALRALSQLGWRMPTTENEVADLEAWAREQLVSDRMKSRDALFRPRRGIPRLMQRTTGEGFQEAEDLLARAAREGKDISPEVAERMERDRKQAESDDANSGR